MVEISKSDAVKIVTKLLNSPIAPGGFSSFINVGTDLILDSLEENYFRNALSDNISCFKYLEGDYGSGKTQFIHSLAERAHRNGIVTSIVSIGEECPFNSPLAIYRSLVSGFVTPEGARQDERGIEIVVQSAIRKRLAEMGVAEGTTVPDEVRAEIEASFKRLVLGSADTQTAVGLSTLARVLLGDECGDAPTPLVTELVSWLRGDKIASKILRDRGLTEPASDANSFKRLKTIVGFLRKRLAVRGVYMAFDEGTRTNAFRRGTQKQRQAIENMLTMINENAEGAFGGVMFLYAATPDFRAEVISKLYTALNDRIGTVAFAAGSPMVPLIDLDSQITDQLLQDLALRLPEVFGVARGVVWDEATQLANASRLVSAQKRQFIYTRVPPRVFVYQYCRFLDQQTKGQRQFSDEEVSQFVGANDLTVLEEDP